MKLKLMLITSVFYLLSCGEKKTETNTDENIKKDTTEAAVVGEDKDPNGCITSAGFTWSQVKNKCIQPFTDGLAFEEYMPEAGKSTSAAYVVLSDDKSKAEIFWGGTDKPALLTKANVVEGDIAPILYENKTEMVNIQRNKDGFNILYNGKVVYRLISTETEL
ncbi:MAG: hypothetical protein ACOVQ2_01085 [Flavobacterium sp.]